MVRKRQFTETATCQEAENNRTDSCAPAASSAFVDELVLGELLTELFPIGQVIIVVCGPKPTYRYRW